MAFVYSCCFWFSLRLGGILIASFLIVQALLFLIIFCMAYNRPQYIRNEIASWINTMKLMYIKDYLEYFQTNTEKYLSYCITFLIIYIFVSSLYLYGAYMCKNILMIPFIIIELFRLLLISTILIIYLLVLKQNTMDIGLLIGASVAVGFILLGMFYLWVCAANLPILINEMDHDEKLATITKLQNLLTNNRSKFNHRYYNGHLGSEFDGARSKDLFVPQRGLRIGMAGFQTFRQ